MKREERLLSLMGDVQDRYLLEAQEYQHHTIRHRNSIKKKITVAVAAAVIMTISMTAMAMNASWRDTIRSWLGISDTGANGYEEYLDQSVTLDDMTITQISELCSGNQLVAYFEVTPAEGDTLDTDMQWQVQIQDEQLWADNINLSQVDMVSQSETDILLKYTVGFDDISTVQKVPLKFFVYPKNTEPTDETIVFSGQMELRPVETQILAAKTDIVMENKAADSTGKITSVRIDSGSIEIVVAEETFENWCNRVCVPDFGRSFMQQYTGSAWEPEVPEDDDAYFSAKDERKIADAFAETWANTISDAIGTVAITRKDGTVLYAEGEPVLSENIENGEEGYDSCTYRYTILPLVDIDEIESAKIMGQTLELQKTTSSSPS